MKAEGKVLLIHSTVAHFFLSVVGYEPVTLHPRTSGPQLTMIIIVIIYNHGVERKY